MTRIGPLRKLCGAAALLLASPVKLRLIHHRNNLWPVLLYWPVLLGSVLLATLYLFFIA